MLLVRLLIQGGFCAVALLITSTPGVTDPPKEPPAKIDLNLIPDPDVEWLKREKIATDDAGLLAFLRSCQGKDISPADIDAAIAKLMTGSKAEQDDAAKKLAEYGTIAVPPLRKNRTAPDPLAAKRVRDCLEKIEEVGDKPLARPTMRRLLIRRPAGTAEAMLGYLPFASDPAAEEDIYYGLDALVDKDAKTLTVLATMLKDAQPSRRAVSACILGRRGNAEQKQAVRELLKDADALVRLRAAQGLLAGHDACGVATLIDLLTDPSIEIAWQAEELLRWVSNETAPDVVVGGAAAGGGRSEARPAWLQWAKDHAAKINFTELEKEPRRPLLLLGYERTKGKLWIFGSDGVTRCEWQLKGGLADAQYVPGGTVLTLHEQPVREKPLLAERDRAGKVLWQYDDLADPKYVQRLSNGHVFAAEFVAKNNSPTFRYRVMARPDRMVFSPPPTAIGDTHSAVLYLSDGRVVAHDRPSRRADDPSGGLVVYDPRTNTSSDSAGGYPSFRSQVEIHATQSNWLLLSSLGRAKETREHEIVEWDRFPEVRWRHKLAHSSYAHRLRSGITVACTPTRIVEISQDHREVAEIPAREVVDVARPCLPLLRFGFDTYSPEFDLTRARQYRILRLKHRDSFQRRFNLDQLAEMNPPPAEYLKDLKKLLADSDPEVRRAADRARLAAGDKEIPRQLELVKHTDARIRIEALIVLSKYSRSPEVIDALIAALTDEKKEVRHFAARVLGSPDSNEHDNRTLWLKGRNSWAADRIVPALMKAATDPSNADDELDRNVQVQAIRGIGSMGKGARPAVDLVIKGLRHENVSYRYRSAEALGGLGAASDEVVSALIKEVERPDGMRGMAAESLGEIGPPAARAIETLISFFSKRNGECPMVTEHARNIALAALVQIAPRDKRVLALLSRVVADEKEPFNVRLEAGFRLSRLSSHTARDLVPVLEKWLLTIEARVERSKVSDLLASARYRATESDR